MLSYLTGSFLLGYMEVRYSLLYYVLLMQASMFICEFTCTYTGNEKPELKDLYDYVAVKCASNWKQLGIILNINEDLLKIIEKDHLQNCEECCSKMLYDWLELTPDATWAMLLEAVDKVQSIQDNARGMYVHAYLKVFITYVHMI